jgi:hypothetical protein
LHRHSGDPSILEPSSPDLHGRVNCFFAPATSSLLCRTLLGERPTDGPLAVTVILGPAASRAENTFSHARGRCGSLTGFSHIFHARASSLPSATRTICREGAHFPSLLSPLLQSARITQRKVQGVQTLQHCNRPRTKWGEAIVRFDHGPPWQHQQIDPRV